VNVYCFRRSRTLRKTRPNRQNKHGPAGNTPDGAMVNSALCEPIYRYRQTPSFQMLISWQPRRSALVSLPLAVSSTI
jgi:hypothetical protein